MNSRDHMDPVLARELEQVFQKLVENPHEHPLRNDSTRSSITTHRSAWITAVVGVAVVLVAVLAIRYVGADRSQPATTPTSATSASSNASLLDQLPTQPHARAVHTWTSGDTTSGPFDVTGRTIVMTGVCDGGGTVLLKVPGSSATKLNCSKRSLRTPYWKSSRDDTQGGAVETSPVRVRVTVASGHPDYVVRMWAVDPRILAAEGGRDYIGTTSATVPSSMRTCTANDLSADGTFDRIGSKQNGIVTITNHSSTACAVRAWPAMRYLDHDNAQVGPTEAGENLNGRSLDSSEGTPNKYGEFPPARLPAGGHGYLIADLRTQADLNDFDATQKAQNKKPRPSGFPPSPLCNPATVTAIELTIGEATVRVPAPQNPLPAACRIGSLSLTVTPVVAHRPDTP